MKTIVIRKLTQGVSLDTWLLRSSIYRFGGSIRAAKAISQGNSKQWKSKYKIVAMLIIVMLSSVACVNQPTKGFCEENDLKKVICIKNIFDLLFKESTGTNGNSSTGASTFTSTNGNSSTGTSTFTSTNGNSSTGTSTFTSTNGNSSTGTSTYTSTSVCSSGSSESQSCYVANGSGSQSRTCQSNGNWGGWSSCQVTGCDVNFHQEGSLCVSNEKSCSISNGTGKQVWNGSSWGTCTLVSCNSGYEPSANSCVAVPALAINSGSTTYGSMTTWPYTRDTIKIEASITSWGALRVEIYKADGSTYTTSGKYYIQFASGETIVSGSFLPGYTLIRQDVEKEWLNMGRNFLKVLLKSDPPNNAETESNIPFEVQRNR